MLPSCRSMGLACCLLVVSVECQAQQSDVADAKPALPSLITTEGIEFPGGEAVVLAGPRFDRSLVGAKRQAVLERIAGGIGWERFSRDSVVAPIEIDLESIKNEAGERIGHLVSVAFVAHVPIDQLRSREQMQAVFGAAPAEASSEASGQQGAKERAASDSAQAHSDQAHSYQAREIPAEELAQVGISTTSPDTTYFAIELPLLDRILVSGWLRVEYADSPDQVAIGWLLDPRFISPEGSAGKNFWRPLETKRAQPSGSDDHHTYQGVGGYLQATRLSQPEGASLIEVRLAIHEPPEWFRGSNLLRSKLPLMIQESVRKFRRQWSERTH